MVRTVGFKDPGRLDLIRDLKETSSKSESKLWSAVADELSKVRRNRREVNVHSIQKYSIVGDIVVIPGKVLGDGNLTHKVDVAAFKFTEGAQEKIKAAGGRIMTIAELLKANPKGSKIKLIG